MAEVKFYLTSTVDEPMTFEVTLHTGDADTVCEECPDSCDGRVMVDTLEYPYDYQSAYTVHAKCLDWTFLTDPRPQP